MIKKIRILNDTEFEFENVIYINKKLCGLIAQRKEYEFTVTTEEQTQITIIKNDIWDNKKIVNYFLIIFCSLDFLFGGALDVNNMPIEINYSFDSSNVDIIKMSEIICVKSDNLEMWKRYSAVQIIEILFLVLVIEIIGTIISGKIVLGVILSLIIDIYLIIILKRQRKKYCDILNKFV